MAELQFQLEAGLIEGKAHALVLPQLKDEMVTFRYNKRTGIANVETRAFPAFPEPEPESEESKIVNGLAEQFNAGIRSLERDREQLGKREAEALARERKLDEREKLMNQDRELLIKQRKKFEADLNRAAKKGLLAGIKSFFNRQT
jgi:hypothetical protein